MSTTQVILGDLTLEGLEIPESIPFAIKQALAVQTLIGGARTIDAMGRDDQPITWSGYFMGPNAMQRALFLQNQCATAQELTLTWDQLNYQVIIDSFEPDYEFAYRIPYRISCTVIQDNTNPVTDAPSSGVDDQMNSDLQTAVSLASLIGDSKLAGLIGNIGTAMSGVPTFTNAPQSLLATVLSPIQTAQTYTQGLLTSSMSAIPSPGTVGNSLGGVVAGAPVQDLVASLISQTSATQAQPSVLSMTSVLGRMAANVNSIRDSSTSMKTAGGNLYDIASQQYGDATSWTSIAKANGLTDPDLSGVQTLIVPTQPDTAGGILVG